jgi:hypothetical protein
MLGLGYYSVAWLLLPFFFVIANGCSWHSL